MPITGAQKQQLDEALRDGFRNRLALKRMLSLQCDRNLEDYVGNGGLKQVVPELIDAADSEDWISGLIRGAAAENPGNVRLRKLYDSAWFTLAADVPTRKSLESMIDPAQAFIDVDGWLSAAQQMTNRVCRVERQDGTALGTGFLVGPASVLTNYHVVAEFIASTDPVPLVFRFGLQVLADGSQNEGTVVAAASSGWLTASAPYSDSDLHSEPTDLPSSEELDFALIALQERRGEISGWLDIANAAEPPAPSQPLAILQHPLALPLKLAIDTTGVIGLNGNGTRLRYRTNTQPGSSGSPCFDIGWKPVALHHSGDPAAAQFPPKRNAGIPLQLIFDHIKLKGKEALLQ